MRTNERAVGIIIRDNKILIFRRFKDGEHYFAFPGGGVEGGETAEEAVIREMKEELCIDIKIDKLLFVISIEQEDNKLFQIEAGKDLSGYSKDQLFYLIRDFKGEPQLGGPEKERSNETNQYHLTWIPFSDMEKTADLYPEEGKVKLVEMIKEGKF